MTPSIPAQNDIKIELVEKEVGDESERCDDEAEDVELHVGVDARLITKLGVVDKAEDDPGGNEEDGRCCSMGAFKYYQRAHNVIVIAPHLT